MNEHKVAIKNDEVSFKNVPANLEGIELGDKIVVTEYPACREYNDAQKAAKGIVIEANEYFAICCESNDPVYFYLGDGFPEKWKKHMLENGYKGGFNDEVIEIYPDMFTFVHKKEKATASKPTYHNYSLEVKADDDIIKEMIEKVDFDRFKKLMAISIGKNATVTDEVAMKFLNMWAKAKAHFYIAFGRQLTISKPIEYKMDENEMAPLVYEMYKKWPKYAATIDKIMESGGTQSFIDNNCPRCDFFEKYTTFYKRGMKISKFFSQLFKDEQFDIDFSKVMQDRIIKGFIRISIDPYDFATSGTNMHGWSTCQKIYGDMAGGAFTYITDPNALIAYRDNGKEYTYDKLYSRGVGGDHEQYDFGRNKFVGNSKSWRELIHADFKNCAFLFSREYPQNKTIEVVFDATRELLEEVIGKYAGISDWDNYGDLREIATRNYFGPHPVYKDVTKHHYSDVGNWEGLTRQYKIKKALIAPTGTDMSKVQITAGGDLICFKCGKKLGKEGKYTICGDC